MHQSKGKTMSIFFDSRVKLDQVPPRYYNPESEVELAALTRCEKIPTEIVATQDDGAARVAREVAAAIARCVQERGRCVIGFGVGSSISQVCDELVKLYFADKVSFADVVVFNLAELGLGNGEGDGHKALARLQDTLFAKVDISPDNIHTFSRHATRETVHRLCREYEQEIRDAGGLDLVLCEITKDGTLAYNEPGSTLTSTTRLMLLGDDARARISEMLQTDTVPATAVTLGISNIMAAREVIAVALQENCAQALRDTVEGTLTDRVPASFLQMHPQAKIVADLTAASLFTRISFPWKVASSCDWTDKLIKRAIIWLCRQTGKPILKLSTQDYHTYGLGELLALYGSAYDVNVKVFHMLQGGITYRPGGDTADHPERKRVLAFSPHPDDVIVSMGGTLARLIEQGHDVHVAVQTDGDLAVSNDNLFYNLMLLERLSGHFGFLDDQRAAMADMVTQELLTESPAHQDSPKQRFFKGSVFVCEGMLACKEVGVKDDHLHQMELPFYTHHPTGKGPVTQADAEIVARLIEQVRPHQIYLAADVTDPYGTHLRAANAVLMALSLLKDKDWMRGCRVWMYRGQWGHWQVDNVEMAVPLSPEEFKFKRDAILKFHSQIHDAPFRNKDGQLPWQRSLDCNIKMAEVYDRLGLATYEAMETFVQLPPDE